MRLLAHPWWLKSCGQDTYALGLTAKACELLGQLSFVDLPNPGTELKVGMPFASFEGTRMVISLDSPVNGRVLQVNPNLAGLVLPTVNNHDYLLKIEAKSCELN